ncbi:hypothetical protein FF38_07980 [Lucilia cuprina]|uniref:Uncharacterized protein n=1 Tax=Lucilia cuprina TaxID=7375 RepID=A0A0L0C8S2_LUCCU|nr:hypothetical protein FF38_07980 [Lucilia cuprina]
MKNKKLQQTIRQIKFIINVLLLFRFNPLGIKSPTANLHYLFVCLLKYVRLKKMHGFVNEPLRTTNKTLKRTNCNMGDEKATIETNKAKNMQYMKLATPQLKLCSKHQEVKLKRRQTDRSTNTFIEAGNKLLDKKTQKNKRSCLRRVVKERGKIHVDIQRPTWQVNNNNNNYYNVLKMLTMMMIMMKTTQ